MWVRHHQWFNVRLQGRSFKDIPSACNTISLSCISLSLLYASTKGKCFIPSFPYCCHVFLLYSHPYIGLNPLNLLLLTKFYFKVFILNMTVSFCLKKGKEKGSFFCTFCPLFGGRHNLLFNKYCKFYDSYNELILSHVFSIV